MASRQANPGPAAGQLGVVRTENGRGGQKGPTWFPFCIFLLLPLISPLGQRGWEGYGRRHGPGRRQQDPTRRERPYRRRRFHDGLPIRDIAKRWDEDPAKIHHEYAIARDEFRAALREVVTFHHPTASARELERLTAELLATVG